MNGKLSVLNVTHSWTEGVFYWPIDFGCTENDQHLILDLFITWKNVNFEHVKDHKIWRNILSNIDEVTAKWLELNTNPFAQEHVAQFSNSFLVAVLHIIWESGFQISMLRKFYPVLVKAAGYFEAVTHAGYKKLVYTKIVIIPTAITVDGIVRKRPVRYYAITALYLDRQHARITELKDFLQIKDQVHAKE